jgi:hypothetical protein
MYIQGKLSNPTHKGTREMCGIIQDVGILSFPFKGTMILLQESKIIVICDINYMYKYKNWKERIYQNSRLQGLTIS